MAASFSSNDASVSLLMQVDYDVFINFVLNMRCRLIEEFLSFFSVLILLLTCFYLLLTVASQPSQAKIYRAASSPTNKCVVVVVASVIDESE